MPNAWHAELRGILSAGHTSEAAYEADEEEPLNANVRATMLGGIPGFIDAKREMPDDVAEDLVTGQNKYGKSSGFTPQQLVRHMHPPKSGWDRYCEDQKKAGNVINVDKLGPAGFEACHKQWLLGHRKEKRLKNMPEFKAVRSFVNWADKTGYTPKLLEWWSKYYDPKADKPDGCICIT